MFLAFKELPARPQVNRKPMGTSALAPSPWTPHMTTPKAAWGCKLWMGQFLWRGQAWTYRKRLPMRGKCSSHPHPPAIPARGSRIKASCPATHPAGEGERGGCILALQRGLGLHGTRRCVLPAT